MSSFSVPEASSRTILPATIVIASIAVLAVSVAAGFSLRIAAGAVVFVTLVAWVRPVYIGWHRLLAGLILVILFIPIRRYTLPGNLPFQLEPYRLLVVVLLVGWGASLLVDRRTRLAATGFEGPLLLIFAAIVGSIVTNPERVEQMSSAVQNDLMFFLSFVLMLYLTASVVRRLDTIDYLVMTLVAGGAVVAFFAIVEARTGINVFNHIDRVLPVLQPGEEGKPGAFLRYGAARLRVFGPAQHPIALSAAFVMLTPLALYLARRYRQRRWWLCVTLLVAGCASTVSRTGIMMFVVVVAVFLWLRPKEVRKLWPALIPALIVIKLVLPGTLGAIKQSFLPAGGLVAEQASKPGEAAVAGSPTSGPRCRSGSRSRSSARASAPGSRTPACGSARTSSTTSGWERFSSWERSASSAGSGSSHASCAGSGRKRRRTTPTEAGCSSRLLRASRHSPSACSPTTPSRSSR